MPIMFSAASRAFYYLDLTGDGVVPDGAVPVSDEDHAHLLEEQSRGKEISVGSDGRPMLIDPAPMTSAQVALARITELESSVSDRRIREAILGIDDGWLANIEAQIAVLRAQLK